MVNFTWCWYVFGIAADAIGGRYDSQTLCNALVLPHLATCIVHEAGTTVVMGVLETNQLSERAPLARTWSTEGDCQLRSILQIVGDRLRSLVFGKLQLGLIQKALIPLACFLSRYGIVRGRCATKVDGPSSHGEDPPRYIGVSNAQPVAPPRERCFSEWSIVNEMPASIFLPASFSRATLEHTRMELPLTTLPDRAWWPRYPRLCEAARAYEVGPTDPGTAQPTAGAQYHRRPKTTTLDFANPSVPRPRNACCPLQATTQSRHNMENVLREAGFSASYYCAPLKEERAGGAGAWTTPSVA